MLWSLLKCATLHQSSIDEVLKVFLPDPYYWFLWALYAIQLIFMAGDIVSEKMIIKQDYCIVTVGIFLILLMVFADVRILGFQYIAYYFLFYLIGFYLHKYDRLLSRSNTMLVTLSFLWVVMAWYWNMHELPSFLSFQIPIPELLIQYVYRFLTALVAVYVLLVASPKLINECKWNQPFIWFGQFSLGIYGAHLLFLYPLTNLVRGNYTNTWVVILIVFVMSVFLSALVVWVLKHWRLTAMLLLGKI